MVVEDDTFVSFKPNLCSCVTKIRLISEYPFDQQHNNKLHNTNNDIANVVAYYVLFINSCSEDTTFYATYI